jgi:hypothetical protein
MFINKRLVDKVPPAHKNSVEEHSGLKILAHIIATHHITKHSNDLRVISRKVSR